MGFKERIKARRQELGLTLEDVAQIVGVSNATISRWESGAIENQRRDKVELLAKALRVSPGELLGWSKDSDGTPPLNARTSNSAFAGAFEYFISTLMGNVTYNVQTNLSDFSSRIQIELRSPDIASVPSLQEAHDCLVAILQDLMGLNAEELHAVLAQADLIVSGAELPAAGAELSSLERRLLSLSRELNQEGQERLLETADDMAASGKYKKYAADAMAAPEA